MLDNIKTIKQNCSLTTILKQEAGVTLSNGYNTCFCCHSKGKLSVLNDQVVRCFKNSCPLSKPHDIFALLIFLNKADSFKDSLKIVSRYYNPLQANLSEQNVSTRSSILKEVYSLYRDQLHLTDYLQTRHLVKAPLKAKVGYAPDAPRFLLSKLGRKYSQTVLEQHGLISPRSGDDLMRNRVVFPICTATNYFVHLQGRSLDPDSSLRWLCTSTMDGRFHSNMDYTYNIENVQHQPVLFLTEGVTDGLSLIELGLPTVSCFGLKPSLQNELRHLSNLTDLIAIFDNDLHELSSNNTTQDYKSWSVVIPRLVELQLYKPNLNIWCVSPPSSRGVKDINQWLLDGLTLNEFEHYCSSNMLSLFDFAFNLFGVKYPLLLPLLHTINSKEKSDFKAAILSQYNDWFDYLLEVV